MGVNNGGAIAMGNGNDSAMDSRMAVQLQLAMVVATRGDATTSRVKHEGGLMRGNIQPANTLRGGVTMRGDAKNQPGKTRGWCNERQGDNKLVC